MQTFILFLCLSLCDYRFLSNARETPLSPVQSLMSNATPIIYGLYDQLRKLPCLPLMLTQCTVHLLWSFMWLYHLPPSASDVLVFIPALKKKNDACLTLLSPTNDFCLQLHLSSARHQAKFFFWSLRSAAPFLIAFVSAYLLCSAMIFLFD